MSQKSPNMALLQKVVSDVKTIHIWTDSHSFKYRNKSVFDILTHFENWMDFKLHDITGHGKSACDGVEQLIWLIKTIQSRNTRCK
ncbi:hypothetical protein MAR_019053 [Mya arenaria]|uniref:Uncharacterized protein n=1 Tax=Mya arenaria TaxID=6604 RepID=A0ABY7EGH0_MYAAR|nr:hypothetical protein MAR_019053 [Mya arenaria]